MINSAERKNTLHLLKQMYSKANIKLYMLAIFATVQLLLILSVNFTKSYAFLDFDSSLGIRHGWEMWKHGLFLEEWNYFSTLEIDSASFFGTGLYVLTRNLNLSLGIAHLFFYLLMVFVIYDLLKNLDKEDLWERTLLAVILIFTPYSAGQLDWANMMFISGGAYEFRVLLMLLFIDLFVMCEKKLYKCRKFYILLFLGGLLNFWVSLSTGNFVLFMILVPIGLKWFCDIIERQEFRLWMPANWVMLLNAVISFFSWRYRNHIAGSSHRNNLNLLAADEFFENLKNCIIGYFYLFQGMVGGQGIGLFSVRGILTIVRFCAALLCLLYTGYLIVSKRRGSHLCRYMICYVIVHFMLFLLVDTQYGSFWEYRYHILWCSLMFVFAADHVIRERNFENKWLYHCNVYGLLMGMFLINAGGFKLCLQGYSDNAFVEKTIEIADDMDAGAVYMCNMEADSHILRAREPDLYCVNIKVGDEEQPHISLAGNIYSYYSDIPALDSDERNIMIATNEEFEKMPEYIQRSYRVLSEVEGGHNAYFSSANYWDGRSGLPAASVDMSIDFPFSDGYQYQGVISGGGVLETGEEEGIVLCSPMMSSSEGNYEIVLHYNILQAGQEDCYVEVTADEGRTVLKKAYLAEDADQIVLSDLQIENDMAVQVRLWKSSHAVIEAGKIIYKRL